MRSRCPLPKEGIGNAMYAKYHTDALVLGSVPRGESDRSVALYTREFGFMRARATAVRKESSRMRYALVHYAEARVSLVRGAGGWRLAGATARVCLDGEATPAFARVAQLVIRLVPGEEKHETLFAVLAEAHHALREEPHRAATIELLCVARILHALGYLSVESVESALFAHAQYVDETLSEAEARRDMLLLSVNRALSETQL